MASPTITAPPIWQRAPERVQRLAVLRADTLIYYRHADPRQHPTDYEAHELVTAGDSLAYLARSCWDAGCGTLWLAAPYARDWAAQARTLLRQGSAELEGFRIQPISSASRRLVGLQLYQGRPLFIHLLAEGDPWGLAGMRDASPRELAEGVMLAEWLLGIQLRSSASKAGHMLMQEALSHHRAGIPPLSDWVRDLCLEHAPHYIQWSRMIESDQIQPEGCEVYKYDRHFSFVASSGEVPVGDPVKWKGDALVRSQPGLYHIRFQAPAAWHSRLPGPFYVGSGQGVYPLSGECWAWAPAIRLATQEDWAVEILSGWVWAHTRERPAKADLLRPWRERLWSARLAAEDYGGVAGRVARTIIKKVGVSAIGRLKQVAGHKVVSIEEAKTEKLHIWSREIDQGGRWTGMAEVDVEPVPSELLRPDWWGWTIACAMERCRAATYRHRASLPIGEYHDCGYYLRPWGESDPDLAEQLGKWRLDWAIRLDRRSVATWQALGSTVERIKLLAHGADRGEEIEEE